MMLTAFRYLENGELDSTGTIDMSDLDQTLVSHFKGDLMSLSGDLELPMERPVPDIEHLEYRIGSDLKGGAFVLYYFHDELIMASLLLSGSHEEPENDLLQVFKYLLLEPEGIDEEEGPTDEEIDEILALDAFDFESVSERPVLFSVVYELEPNAEKESHYVEKMNAHLASAFFALPTEKMMTINPRAKSLSRIQFQLGRLLSN
jgi:hypothetical protein